ncbi:MAG: hypothetical protein LUG98_03965 [Tannerellaceae bacterium]|nr:hypothetical protein [Tannerellaceae bacterium]
MKKIDSLITLLHSLSKAEKKHLSLQLLKGNEEKDYLLVFQLITKNGLADPDILKKEFAGVRPGASFEIAVHYLYEKALDTLLGLRKKRDLHYDLFIKISKARMLYDRSLFYDCLELLAEVIETARKFELYEISMIAGKLELEYLLRLNFPSISQQELYHKHYRQVEAIKHIRKTTEQSSLYDLLKYRLIHMGNIRTDQQKKDMNDLMVSEFYLASSSGMDTNFEITKNHQLFQASYLMATGDFKSALQALRELNRLFEENPQFWAKPPIYYVSVLEGILNGLRFERNYEEMGYFVEKLSHLIENTSVEFRVNTTCLIFQYELFPLLDKGDFTACLGLVEKYKTSLYDKESALNPIRRCELLLYTSLVYLGIQDYRTARKVINRVLIDKRIEYLPLMKIIRLVRLMVYYELGESDLVRYETHSIRRGLSLKKEQFFQTEHTMLWFLNKEHLPVLRKDKEEMWEKLSARFARWHQDRFERQILHIFDFSAWIEAKLFRKPLATILQEKQH